MRGKGSHVYNSHTFARFTPSASLQICIANPALFGEFEPGQKYYVDFTPV